VTSNALNQSTSLLLVQLISCHSIVFPTSFFVTLKVERTFIVTKAVNPAKAIKKLVAIRTAFAN